MTHTLSANVENLTLTGTTNINGTGNALANSIIGNSGNNVLMGNAGNDTLMGGGGVDTLNGGADNDIFRYLAKTDSTLSAMDTLADFASGDSIDFVGIGGMATVGTPYTYQTSVANTISMIQADAAISNSIVFFTNAVDGYLYLKGVGTGIDFDGTLIKLAGKTTAFDPAQLTNTAPLSPHQPAPAWPRTSPPVPLPIPSPPPTPMPDRR